MENMGDDQYRINLRKKTTESIERKLQKLEEDEKEVIRAIKDLIEDKKLYEASYGRLDLRQVDRGNDTAALREARDKIMKKHANLLKKSNAYNRRSIDMTNILHAISEAIYGKLDSAENKNKTGDNYLSNILP
jgi:phosphoenolpyruvate-protein kinase (PTS system EI component)